MAAAPACEAPVPAAMRHVIEAGLAGIASFDRHGVVRSREGVLSSWLAGVGESCFESPILSGLHDDIEALRRADGGTAPLVLPGLRLAMISAMPRCDIAITWDAAAQVHVVLTTIDQVDRPIDHWVVQQKREQRILEEKIVVASRELERVNENLRQFTSVAAHDLQAPLRQIGAYARLLRAALAPERSGAAQVYIDTIESCATRLGQMIAGLLDYARLGSTRFDFEPVDLKAIVEDVRGTLMFDIEACKAVVTSSGLPRISGSPILLTNLLQNLIGNSLRYAAPGRVPTIDVAGWEVAGTVCGLSITDNGIGVPPRHAETIFESFVRVPTRAAPEGVGLGLSIARKIAELHGWRLRLDPDYGPGARFVIDMRSRLDRDRRGATGGMREG